MLKIRNNYFVIEKGEKIMETVTMDKKDDKEILLMYPRLEARMKELSMLYKQEQKDEYLMEDYCIVHFLGGSGREIYEKIASFCKEREIGRVFDIGCAGGHQSEAFMTDGVEYVGVEPSKMDYWNKDNLQYITSSYPCTLPTQKGDMAISVLCLTWNCFLYEGEKTLIEQCEALKKDFDHCLLYVQPDKVEIVSRYFNKVEKITPELYYFSNIGA